MAGESGSGFAWFLLGLGVGAAAGVLYAPKAGQEMRDNLRQQARDGGEFIKQKSRLAADQVNTMIDSGRTQMNEYAGRGKEAFERGRGQWETYVDKGRQAVAGQSDKLSAAIEAGKQAYKSSTTTPPASSAAAGESV